MKNETATILDTSAFIHGYGVNFQEKYYTVPSVKKEIKSEINKLKYENSIKSGYLKELTPDSKYTSKINSFVMNEGEEGSLSPTDIQILALAQQLKTTGMIPIVVTDDYSIQNILSKLNIRHKSLTTKGINRKVRWLIYCPGCRRNYQKFTSDRKCPVCGTELNRKPKNKESI